MLKKCYQHGVFFEASRGRCHSCRMNQNDHPVSYASPQATAMRHIREGLSARERLWLER